jgi:hypothetical protein
MKLIFECETELGRCDPDWVSGHFGNEGGDWFAFAHTTAAVTGSLGMLKIEQRCYFRSSLHTDDIRPQSWVRPEMSVEPASGSKTAIRQAVQQLHLEFVRRAREEFIAQSVLLFAHGACPV